MSKDDQPTRGRAPRLGLPVTERLVGKVTNGNGGGFLDPAFMANRDAPVHRWVPWIAGYSKHFVEDAINRYTAGPSVVLDPFAGVGTTLLEADLAGHKAIGFRDKPLCCVRGDREAESPPGGSGSPSKHRQSLRSVHGAG